MINQFLLVFILLFFIQELNSQDRSIKTLGLTFNQLSDNNNIANNSSFIALDWQEYGLNEEEFFTPFYNLSIGTSIDENQFKNYYIAVSPGVRVNLSSWYNNSADDFTFYDFELSTGIFTYSDNNLDKSFSGIKTNLNYIIQYKMLILKLGLSTYSNMPFDASTNLNLSYRF